MLRGSRGGAIMRASWRCTRGWEARGSLGGLLSDGVGCKGGWEGYVECRGEGASCDAARAHSSMRALRALTLSMSCMLVSMSTSFAVES